MRKALFGLLALVSLASAQNTYTYSYGGLPLQIYPDDWNVVSVIRIFVPKSIQISKVTASAQVQFSGVGDLNVYLYSAAGTRTKLLERNCGGLVNINTTFDDAAPQKFADFCPTEAGRGPFRGNEPLSNSNNENAYGYWRLAVENNGSSRTGFLTGFSVTITGTSLGPPIISPTTIVSTSSFEGGALAPGDQIAIVGANLGPSDGVRATPNPNLPTSLGGTSVMFDGVAVPLYFVSDQAVVVHTPTSLNPGSGTNIQVVSSSGSSSTVSLPVAPANPGIYTYESGGKGQARALNQDGSPNGDGSNTTNGSDKPAAAGSTIQLFATGLGALNPAIPAGSPAPIGSLSNTVLPVTATIAGRSATVGFSGAAPGLIGVYQVNITVPLSTPSGANRIFLSVVGADSQNGVTIQVR